MADRVEGRNAVDALLAAERPVRTIYLLEHPKAGGPLDRIRSEAVARGVDVREVPRRTLDSMSERGAHQGVIAEVAPFEYASLAEVLAGSGTGPALLIALDHVTDPGNLGAVVRTADAAGALGVLVPKDRAAAMSPSAMKAAAGAAEYVSVCREPNLVRALESCKEHGFWVIGGSEDAEALAWEAPLDGRVVLVLGAEGTGLARLTQRACDLLVRLPIAGHVSSLNVSAAAAVLAYEWVRRNAHGG